MPKIRDIICNQFKATISYKTSQSVFSLSIKDADLIEFSNPEGYSNHVITGSTEESVIREFNILVRNYLEKGIKKEKYLAINIESKYDCNDDVYRAGGVSSILKLQWCIVTKITVDGKAVYKNDKGEHYWECSDSKLIPWTEKREVFLKQMTTSLQEMADKVQAFFDNTDLDKRIDTKKILLLAKE